MTTLIIPDRLPGYNELTQGHWTTQRKVKNQAMEDVMWYIKQQVTRKYIQKVRIEIRCYEPNRRRDDDNVTSGAAKVILDALQHAGVIQGDGQKYVQCVKHPVEVNRENPRIVVNIEEV